MAPYARPAIEEPVAGSADRHRERFAPLHEVADALLSYLVRAYDVAVVHDVRTAGDLATVVVEPPASDVLQAVRLTPSDPSAAPMTIVWDAHQGVSVGAGAAFEAHVPVGGDETWHQGADVLERVALAIAEGRMQEHVARWPRAGHGHRIRAADGESSGWTPVDRVAGSDARARRRRLREASRRLAARRDGAWAPWPRRPLP